MGTIVIVIIIALIIVGFASGGAGPDNRQKVRVDYSKDYMNNPIVRDMNERDYK